MNSRRFDCICAGIVVADHVCDPIDHMPAAGELITTDRLQLTIGGCASNAAVDLAKLGVNVGIVGIVGRDVFGRYVRESLQTSGVNCDFLIESESQQTSGTLVVNVQGEDRRFIHTIGANAEFNGSEVTPELIDGCRVLYLGGYCISDKPTADNIAKLLQTAQQAGVITVLDVVIPTPGEYWSRLRPVLPHTDVFLPNDDEAQLITGINDPLEQAQAFREAGAKTVVITCGGEGAVLVGNDVQLRAGTDQVEFIDGTGSGDAFVAGYIHGLLNGKDARECLRNGSALGASCVRKIGATSGVFTADELSEFIASTKLQIQTI